MLEWKLDWGRSDSAPQELFRTLSPNQIQETKLDWIKDTRLLAGLYSRTIKSTNNDSKTSRASLHFLFFSEKVNWSLRTTQETALDHNSPTYDGTPSTGGNGKYYVY